MIVEIVRHTPVWVFAVFVALVGLGARQLRPGGLSLTRLALTPIVMGSLSLYGVLSTFGSQSAAVFGWAAMVVAGLCAGLTMPPRTGVQYSADTRSFTVPGSAVPLVLMMAIFLTKYATAVLFAFHPELRATTVVALGVGVASGVMSAVFIARAFRTARIAFTLPSLRRVSGAAS